jgi:hypothetical protein
MSALIFYQDLKTRLINLWSIICLATFNYLQYLLTHSIFDFIENSLFCLCYFALLYGVIHLYLYFKTGRFQKIINTKLGLGDILIMPALGFCIEPLFIIPFFTAALVLSLVVQLLLVGKEKTVPLAGFLVLAYLLFFLMKAVDVL